MATFDFVIRGLPLALLLAGVAAVIARRGRAAMWLLELGAVCAVGATGHAAVAHYRATVAAGRGPEAMPAGQELVNEPWYRLVREAAGHGPSAWPAGRAGLASVCACIAVGLAGRSGRGRRLGALAFGGVSVALLGWNAARGPTGVGLSAVSAHVVVGCAGVGAVVAGIASRSACPTGPSTPGQNERTSPEVPTRSHALGRVLLLAGLLTGVPAAMRGAWDRSTAMALLGQPRDLAHLIVGMVALVLAIAPRRTRSRCVVRMMAVAALLATAYVGILLLFDGSAGAASIFWRESPYAQGS